MLFLAVLDDDIEGWMTIKRKITAHDEIKLSN
jgi:hypothetical protein